MSPALDRQRAARYVKARRGQLGYSQRELAEKAGLDTKTINYVESSERWPQATTRAAIEEALEWESGDILKAAEGGEPTPTRTRRSRGHLSAAESPVGTGLPDEFGLGDEPPFPDQTNTAGLDTGQVLNRIWAVAKELEALYYAEHGTRSERQLRVIKQWELATETLIEELGDAGLQIGADTSRLSKRRHKS